MDSTGESLHAEFTVEPFVPGKIGVHVSSAIDAARAGGARVEVGPFATSVRADEPATVLSAVDAALRAAIANGATSFSLRVDVDDAG